MDEALFKIITSVVSILVVVVLRYLVPLAKIKLGDAKYAAIIELINKGINAAEAIYKYKEKSGEDKKKFVIDLVTKYAKENKINITEDRIKVLLEAVFNELDGKTVNTNK